MGPLFSPREVASLADVPVRSVHRAVEDKVFIGLPRHKQGRRRKLPLYAVPYAAIIERLPILLSLAQKRDIALLLSVRSLERMIDIPIPIGTAVTVDLVRLIGSDLAVKADRYGRLRDAIIEFDAKLTDGAPMVRGTDMTVYALASRLLAGETVEGVRLEYPALSAEDIETAVFYARTHPALGRPVEGVLADAS